MSRRKNRKTRATTVATPAAVARKGPSRRATLATAGILLVTSLLVYGPALRGEFIWDDESYVTHNTTLRSGEGLARIWLEPGATPQYYPLVFTSFWVEYRLWGLNSTGYHVVNVLLHVASAVVLYRLLVLLCVPGAALAAALFALHPVHVESVAWITERKNVLSGVFCLSALLAYVRFARLDTADEAPRGPWRSYAASIVLFVAALLSKSVTVTFPAALLLISWWRKKRLSARDAVLVLPMFLPAVAMARMTMWMEAHHVGAERINLDFTPVERCLIAGRALWYYVAKLVWPAELIFIYPRWTIDPTAPQQYVWPLAAVLLIAALWVFRRRLGKAPLTAAALFVGTLAPALGFVNFYPMRFSFVADHFQYLASLGVLVPVAALLTNLAARASPHRRPAVAATTFIVPLALAVRSWNQCGMYADLETLWRQTLARNPGAWMAHNNYADLLAARNRLDEAIAHYEAGLALMPDHPRARSNLGGVLLRKGRVEDALAQCREAIRLDPRQSEAFSNLGAALAQRGEHDAAINAFREALRINPAFLNAQINLANLLALHGRHREALPLFEDLVQRLPLAAELRANLARSYEALGRREDAVREYREVLRLSPQDPAAAAALKNLPGKATSP